MTSIRSAVMILLLLVNCCGLTQAQAAHPLRLTLHDAIERGLQANLSVLVAETRVEETEGTRTRRLSAVLLPRVRGQSYANVQSRNLRAFGISFPGVPEVVGPFSNFYFRIYADQNIVDLQSYRSLKASERALEAGKLDYQDVRDLIIRSIAGLYLNSQSAAARVDAARQLQRCDGEVGPRRVAVDQEGGEPPAEKAWTLPGHFAAVAVV